MKRPLDIAHKFVATIPDELEELTLYVSMNYATAMHLCCCGCGQEVVTPLSPTDWTLVYNGVSVSLSPSIGNWSFKCRSHYWISRSKVRWARQWSRRKINAGRAYDQRLKSRYYGESETNPRSIGPPVQNTTIKRFWKRILVFWWQ